MVEYPPETLVERHLSQPNLDPEIGRYSMILVTPLKMRLS